jgi:hypothetical protein
MAARARAAGCGEGAAVTFFILFCGIASLAQFGFTGALTIPNMADDLDMDAFLNDSPKKSSSTRRTYGSTSVKSKGGSKYGSSGGYGSSSSSASSSNSRRYGEGTAKKGGFVDPR